MGARRLDLAFHRVDGRVERIRRGTARPNRDPRHLAGLLSAKLDTIDPGLGIEDMILAVFAVDPLPPEQLASRFQNPSLPGRDPGITGEGASRGAARGAGFRQCPKCGEAALIRIENCDQCTSCDYSKCG
jgi:protein ImuB